MRHPLLLILLHLRLLLLLVLLVLFLPFPLSLILRSFRAAAPFSWLVFARRRSSGRCRRYGRAGRGCYGGRGHLMDIV